MCILLTLAGLSHCAGARAERGVGGEGLQRVCQGTKNREENGNRGGKGKWERAKVMEGHCGSE